MKELKKNTSKSKTNVAVIKKIVKSWGFIVIVIMIGFGYNLTDCTLKYNYGIHLNIFCAFYWFNLVLL